MSARTSSAAWPVEVSEKRSVTPPFVLRQRLEAPVLRHDTRTQSVPHLGEEEHVQLAAVNADLGIGVAGMPAARLAIDQLAEAVVEGAFPVLDAGREELLLQAEFGQFLDAVRQQRVIPTPSSLSSGAAS
jgi:hypothetical protein